jgi:hypothetical protein
MRHTSAFFLFILRATLLLFVVTSSRKEKALPYAHFPPITGVPAFPDYLRSPHAPLGVPLNETTYIGLAHNEVADKSRWHRVYLKLRHHPKSHLVIAFLGGMYELINSTYSTVRNVLLCQLQVIDLL